MPDTTISTTNRSKVTNGKVLLDGIDGRSAAGRRFRDLVRAFEADLGGAENLTAAERSIVKQAAAATVQAEQMAAAVIRGDDVDAEQSVRLHNVAGRLLRSLIGKRAQKAPPSRLAQILRGEDV